MNDRAEDRFRLMARISDSVNYILSRPEHLNPQFLSCVQDLFLRVNQIEGTAQHILAIAQQLPGVEALQQLATFITNFAQTAAQAPALDWEKEVKSIMNHLTEQSAIAAAAVRGDMSRHHKQFMKLVTLSRASMVVDNKSIVDEIEAFFKQNHVILTPQTAANFDAFKARLSQAGADSGMVRQKLNLHAQAVSAAGNILEVLVTPPDEQSPEHQRHRSESQTLPTTSQPTVEVARAIDFGNGSPSPQRGRNSAPVVRQTMQSTSRTSLRSITRPPSVYRQGSHVSERNRVSEATRPTSLSETGHVSTQDPTQAQAPPDPPLHSPASLASP
jgi:hypothetical protein